MLKRVPRWPPVDSEASALLWFDGGVAYIVETAGGSACGDCLFRGGMLFE